MFLLATKSKKEYTIYIEGGIFLKKLLLFLISLTILFSGCSSEPPLQIPESKPEPEKEEFVEPFDDLVPFANYPTEPSGYYHFFKDFAVDFPAGWYKSLNRLVQQDSTTFRYISVFDSIPFESAEKAFKKLDKEYSDCLYSENMTFGGYPAKKYITLNPDGTEKYKKYFYDYYIFLGEKAAHLQYSPGLTKSSKNEREYIEKYLDSIIKPDPDFPESTYDLSPENFLSGENDGYLDFIFGKVIGALSWQSVTGIPFSEYKGFSFAKELSSDVLINVFLSAADDLCYMYESENGNYIIPTEDFYRVLDKYFSGYDFDLNETFLDVEYIDEGKSAVLSGFIGISHINWGGYEMESVSDNGDGSLTVKYISFAVDETEETFSSTGKISERYTFIIRPSKNRCIIEKLEIEHFE